MSSSGVELKLDLMIEQKAVTGGIPSDSFYILQEDNFKILQEDSFGILTENA
jgi:hypothetical protein